MSLDNSECDLSDDRGGPLFRPLGGLEPLHRHQEEAASQLRTFTAPWAQQTKHAWDLMAALWGRMDDQVSEKRFVLDT